MDNTKQQELFNRVKEIFLEVVNTERVAKKFDFYMEVSSKVSKYSKGSGEIALTHLFSKQPLPDHPFIFDASGDDSIVQYIIDKYIELKKTNGSITPEQENSVHELLTEVQSLSSEQYAEPTAEFHGKEIDENFLKEMVHEQNFIRKNSDLLDTNQRITTYLNFVRKQVPQASEYAVWHRLIGSSQEPRWIQKDFPAPYSAKNFIVSEKLKVQIDMLQKTEKGSQMIEQKLSEMQEKYKQFAEDSTLFRILEGKDAYMDMVAADTKGEKFEYPKNFDLPGEGESIEQFINETFQDAEIQEELQELKAHKEKPLEIKEIEENEDQKPENPPFPMR